MPYRHDRDALRARRDDLQRDLEDIRRRAAALEALVHDRAAIERELAEVEARLSRAEASRFSLDDVRVASPCNASWEAMRGDDRVRFCESCQKNVYNLSAMARDEAEQLVSQKEGDLCVRLYQRADGTVISGDCPTGARKKRVRRLAIAVTSAGALAAMAGASMVGATVTQGAVAMPPPTATVQPPAPDPVEVTPDDDVDLDAIPRHATMGKMRVIHDPPVEKKPPSPATPHR